MALNSAGLASEMKAKLLELSYVIDDSKLDEFTTKIAEAVVTHITTNAQVQTLAGAPDGEHTGIVL
jgi:hypothetical protein